MRVGIFIPDKPQELGGGHTFENEVFQALLKQAEKSHHEFVLFAKDRKLADPFAGKFETVTIHYYPIRKLWGTLRGITNLFFSGVLLLPHVFTYEDWIDPFLFRRRIGFFLNLSPTTVTREVPYSTLVWDLQHRLQPFFPEVSARGRWRRREEIFSSQLQRAAVVIVGTERGKSELQRFYGIADERIKILRHPTPSFAFALEDEPKELPERFRFPEGFVFYPAQFWSHKNHVTLLLALRILQDKYSFRPHLVLAGSDQGNLQYVIERAAALGLADHVHSTGFVTRSDLIALYRNASALVYASTFGPENLPPLEAFALGCPVIAAKVAGSEEQLGAAALLIEPTDEAAFAEAIYSVCKEPGLRQSLIEKGYQRAREFTSDDFARGIFEILDEFERIRRCWGEDDRYDSRFSWKHLLYG